MVSRPAPNGTSRERLVAAAAAEFAARGFDGAKVDRIAARARINKAMLYYHFQNKAALYREILRHVFGTVAGAVTAVHAQGGPADEQLRRFIEAIALAAEGAPHFPAMWLREIAEGGRHIDGTIVVEMRRVIDTLGRILHDGRRAGLFRPVNPFVIQMGIVAPLMLFSASAPVRERFRHLVPAAVAAPRREDVVAHVQATTLAALAAPGASSVPGAPRRSRRPSARRPRS
jgi:AcrR family transcriptional regulator